MTTFYELNEVVLLVDNNVIWDLDELGYLDLLFEVAKFVAIPRVIYDNELKQEIRVSNRFKENQIWNITGTGYPVFNQLTNDKQFKRLSQNDRFLVAIAFENKCFCVSNDGPVRTACEFHGVRVTGLLGVLGRAYFQGKIDRIEIDTMISKIQSNEVSCYLHQNIFDEFYRTLPIK